MISAGPYVVSAILLVLLAASLGVSAVGLRRRLMPDWHGAPARLVEAVVAVALLIWLSELLGTLKLFYAGALVASSLVLAGAIAWRLRSSRKSEARLPTGGTDLGGSKSVTGPVGPELLMYAVMVGVIAVVFAHWGLTTKSALDRGMFNFDSLWYHMPFATEFAQSHSIAGLHYTETVFTNWLYPQNSELLHGAGILLTDRDTLSLFLNFGWLAVAFLAAWCVGRLYGRGPLCVIAAAVLLECHTLVVREPGAAKNDLMAAALLLAAIAILLNAYASGRTSPRIAGRSATATLNPGWPVAAAGLAVGLAVGTKSTALAMAAALTVAVLVLAPPGRRVAAGAWWALAGLAGGGYWYLRNLIVVGNPLPQAESIGPITLPHPERLQGGRPDFNIVHYATDTGVWSDYFGPGLEQAFGALWPLVLAAALAGGLMALLPGRDRALRCMGGVALFGFLAYLFTPLSAAGAEGAPEGFAINIRYAVPAMLAGLTLLPVALRASLARAEPPDLTSPPDLPARPVPSLSGPYRYSINGTGWGWGEWGLLGALLVVLLVSDRADAVLRDPDRLFGALIATFAVFLPAALYLAWRRGASARVALAGAAALVVAAIAIGYPVQRHYLEDRFLNADPQTAIPGMRLNSAYRWARDVSDARIGLSGTVAGFQGYGFYGTDLSNEVQYLGREAPQGAFDPIATCGGFRAAVDAADLDYLVTSPFLNFIDPGEPIASPEARWLRGERALRPLLRSGRVTVWKVRGPLHPAGCGARNAPLREIPQQPAP